MQNPATFSPALGVLELCPRSHVYRNNLGTTTATRIEYTFLLSAKIYWKKIQHNKVLMTCAE